MVDCNSTTETGDSEVRNTVNEQSNGPSVRIALASAVGRKVEDLLSGTKGQDPAENAPVTRRTLSEALAVMMIDFMGAMEVEDRPAALERLANRLDDRGRVVGGGETAKLLGATGNVLMRLGM